MHHRGQAPHLFHEAGEGIRQYGLVPVRQRGLRFVVHFDDEAVRSRRHRRESHRDHVVAPSRAVWAACWALSPAACARAVTIPDALSRAFPAASVAP